MAFSEIDQVAPLRLAAVSDPPDCSAFSGTDFPSGFAASLAAKLCSKSWIISSICSIPTEIRIISSVTPESSRSCSDSCSWVVDHGWMASVFASPTLCHRQQPPILRMGKLTTYFARLEIIRKPSTTCEPAAEPPLTPKDRTPPKPLGRYFFASS